MTLIFYENARIFQIIETLLLGLYKNIFFFVSLTIFLKLKVILLTWLFLFIDVRGVISGGLQNSLFLVHPLLFLVTSIKLLKSTRLVFMGLYALALFLGGLWSTQEFNWGGWWNWDLIETPPLYTAFIILLWLHACTTTKSLIKVFFSLKKKKSAIYLVYFIPKIINTGSVHSFVSENSLLLLFLNNLRNLTEVALVVIWFTCLLVFKLKSLGYFKYILVHIGIIFSNYFLTTKYAYLKHGVATSGVILVLIFNKKLISTQLSLKTHLEAASNVWTSNQFNLLSDRLFIFKGVAWVKHTWLYFSQKSIFFQKSIFL